MFTYYLCNQEPLSISQWHNVYLLSLQSRATFNISMAQCLLIIFAIKSHFQYLNGTMFTYYLCNQEPLSISQWHNVYLLSLQSRATSNISMAQCLLIIFAIK